MADTPISDPRFRDAVAALDTGDLEGLERILAEHPTLVQERLPGGEGYFADPYLLWFVAENPIRTKRLAANIVEMTRAILRALDRSGDQSRQAQIDYTLGLVSSGQVSRECGLQIALIDLLMEAGADPGGAMPPALAHREDEAVERLLERGAPLTFLAAICTGRLEEAARLAPAASAEERQAALSGAALYGRADALALVISLGVDVSAFNPLGFHAHCTPLHQAAASGSLDAVRVLAEAGAPLDVKDRLFDGTPCGWAEYLGQTEIADYLRSVQG